MAEKHIRVASIPRWGMVPVTTDLGLRLGRSAVQTLLVKIVTTALLVLVSVVGISVQPDTKSTVAATSTDVAVSLSATDTSANVGSATTGSASGELQGRTAIVALPILVAVGVCAALLGCCVLGFIVIRRHLRGDARGSWFLTRDRLPSTASPALLTRPVRVSLVLLSISRT